MTTETNELNDSRTFKYDAASNLTERIDRLGRKTVYEYDNLNRNTAEKWYDGANLVRTLSFAFDQAGQLASASDPAATYGYTYDTLGRVTYESQSFAGFSPLIEYESTFDNLGQRTGLDAIIAGTADFRNTYSYDNLSRLTSLTQQDVSGGNVVADKRFDFAYEKDGAFARIDRYADLAGSEHVVSSHYAYDGLGRLAKLLHTEGATVPSSGWGTDALAGYQYTYDAASRVASIDSYLDGLTSYAHDDTDQLTSADHTGQTDESYSYDANGNRIMSGHTVGDNNRLLSDGTYNYTYDDEGNRVTKTEISTGEKEEYAWDHRNRLTKVTFKDSSGTVLKTVDQTYDVFNQWIRRSVDADGPGSAAAVDTFFSYEDGQIVLEFDGSAAADLSHRYTWGPAIDQLLADEAVSSLASAGTVTYPLGDHLGTLRDLATYNAATDDTSIANHRRYDSYGNVTSETNAAVDSLFGFTGRPLDISTGLQNNLHRWYVALSGVWLSEDPIGFIGGDSNLIRYVGNSSTRLTDSTGLWWAGDDPLEPSPRNPETTPPGGHAPPPDAEDILESIQKQQELRQRKRPPSICADEWDGAKKRPKESSLESIKKSMQRARKQRGGFIRLPTPPIWMHRMPKMPSMSPMAKEVGPFILLNFGDGIMTHINEEYCEGDLGWAADNFLWNTTFGLMGNEYDRPRDVKAQQRRRDERYEQEVERESRMPHTSPPFINDSP